MDPVDTYLEALGQDLRLGNTTEHSHRPTLKALVQSLATGVTAINEPTRSECGAPDFEIARIHQHGLLRIGHIEAKDVGLSLDDAASSEQLERYRAALPNLVLTDYLEFRWFLNGEQVKRCVIATRDHRDRLRPDSEGIHDLHDLFTAFLARHPERLSSPQALAQRMARLTDLIREVVLQTLQQGRSSATLNDLHKAFGEVLLPHLPADQFADMFAQTLAYGLFAARMQHGSDTAAFRRVDAAREIPRTNPFLRRLFGTVTGPDLDDEPYVGLVEDLTQLLAQANVDALLADFGTATRRKDPVFHFYETFLASYDPTLRERRGVYYTPEPVVSYIVRSVDHVLQHDFGIRNGLASTGRHDDQTHQVLLLDPACGTGTFLYDVIDLIRERFRSDRQGGLWSGYVRDHLLPRLFGFELMMAPYAVAHLKLGLQLAAQDLEPQERNGWAYDFAAEDRLGVYMTNSLQETAARSQLLLGGFLADEANAAARIKQDLPIMVVLGNPPYSGHSANASTIIREVGVGEIYPVREGGRWTGRRRADRARSVPTPTFIGKLLDDYYHVAGEPLGERNPKWLQDDYVKFIRFGQWRVEQTGAGILAYVSNHAYLDNSTFRGMRQELRDSFHEIYLLDLHGNSRKRERSPDGSPDQNVFDIQQGVAIALFIKYPNATGGPARVFHADLWGSRRDKYEWLDRHDVASTEWEELDASHPAYVFKPSGHDIQAEWEAAWDLGDAMPVGSVAVATHRDNLAVAFRPGELEERIADFLDPGRSAAETRTRYFGTQGRGEYPPGDNRDWKMADQRAALQRDARWQHAIQEYQYRPFDRRSILYHEEAIDFPRYDVMKHMVRRENLAIAVGRAGQAVETGRWNVVFVSTLPTDLNLFRRGGNVLRPVYLYPEGSADRDDWSGTLELSDSPWPPGRGGRRPNLNEQCVRELEERTGLIFESDERGDLESRFGPEDVVAYFYAMLWSPGWRARFADYLDTNPPRIPLPSDRDMFKGLVETGRQMIGLCTLSEEALPTADVHFPASGSNTVEASHPKYLGAGEPDPVSGEAIDRGRVYIRSARPRRGDAGQYFEGVQPEVWEFEVGGYQVADKWLRDRKGRELTYDDLRTYMHIIAAIEGMLGCLEQIDAYIPGWPVA